VREIELETAREFGAVAELLAAEGLEQERRPLRCAVRDLCIEVDGGVEPEAGTLTLSFSLGRGQFATAVLREIAGLGDAFEPGADQAGAD
jgi:tRNA(Glu) U13 pseudouridine synthase TruD